MTFSCAVGGGGCGVDGNDGHVYEGLWEVFA